jgi:hypothetical protein
MSSYRAYSHTKRAGRVNKQTLAKVGKVLVIVSRRDSQARGRYGLPTRTQKQIGLGDSAVTVEEYQVWPSAPLAQQGRVR